MPNYQNYRNRDVTIFLNNQVPVLFKAGEIKNLDVEGLEKKYSLYIRKVFPIIKENEEQKEKPTKDTLISEVKQPEPNKESLKEPLIEGNRRPAGRPRKKVDEGYSIFQKEVTVASSENQD